MPKDLIAGPETSHTEDNAVPTNDPVIDNNPNINTVTSTTGSNVNSRTKRARKSRFVVTNDCSCGKLITPDEISSNKGIQVCSARGCETQWVCDDELFPYVDDLTLDCQFHLSCLGFSEVEYNFVCESCEFDASGSKKTRRK